MTNIPYFFKNTPMDLVSSVVPSVVMDEYHEPNKLLGQYLSPRPKMEDTAIEVLLLNGSFEVHDQDVAVLVIQGSDARSNLAYAQELHQCLLQQHLDTVLHLDDGVNRLCKGAELERCAAFLSIPSHKKSLLMSTVKHILATPPHTLSKIAQQGKDPDSKLIFDAHAFNDLRTWALRSIWIPPLLPKSHTFLFTDFACIVDYGLMNGIQFRLHFRHASLRDAAFRKVQRKYVCHEMHDFDPPSLEDKHPSVRGENVRTYIWESPHILTLRSPTNTKAVRKAFVSVVQAICYF